MRELTTVEGLESVVGTRPLAVLMKPIDALDDGCRAIVANAPVAGLGLRDGDGVPHATFVGGAPGFVRVDSPTRISFDLPAGGPHPLQGSGASLVLLLPGVGETLRLTGVVTDGTAGAMHLDLEAAWIHCAKCVLRSGLWESANPAPATRHDHGDEDGGGDGPLVDADVAAFLASARFALVSSWDASGSSDTSPKGDRAGFIRILDDHTLAIPDRKGNRRTDTFHNLMECDEVGLTAVVPGRDDLLHMHGTAYVTDDESLRSTLAVTDGEHPPKAALIVRVERAEIAPNAALRDSRLWDEDARAVPDDDVPDLMRLGAQHIAANKSRGAQATMLRAVTKGLAKTPRFLRKGIDAGYRKELKEEGYR